ncbi:MAG TPA: DNA-binding protein [Blastocatellia bacterium]|nr:DNA-binding protein [Blastocatellia bacterium]
MQRKFFPPHFPLKMLHAIIVPALLVLTIGAGSQGKKIPSSEAKNHIGESCTVCGLVASTRYLETAKGSPTFLNLGKAYPNQECTVLIRGRNRVKFGKPEDEYSGKRICVSGVIDEYKSQPQVEASEKSQITVEP